MEKNNDKTKTSYTEKLGNKDDIKKKNKRKQAKMLTILIIIAIIMDQLTKIFAIKYYTIEQENASTNQGYHILMSVIVVIMIIKYITADNTYIKLDTKLILSFGIAGAVANTIDRLFRGNVVNFINLGKSININLAYIYIIIAWLGMAIILTKNTMKILSDRKKYPERCGTNRKKRKMHKRDPVPNGQNEKKENNHENKN